MSNIRTVLPDDDNYEVAKTSGKTKQIVNYKELSHKIANSEDGTVLEIAVRDRGLYSNIKRALAKRKLFFGTHYDMAYRTVEGKKFIFITVKG